MQHLQTPANPAVNTYDQWFSDFIAKLKVNQLQLETGTASDEVKNFYDSLINGNLESAFNKAEEARQEYFVLKIVASYIKELNGMLPLKLAFDFNQNEVLVWAEIKDNDEEFEKKLLLTEAKVNAQFYPAFTMNSMIVEESDHVTIPNHYKLLKS
ncbi:MAG: hypothetical protein U0T73_05200 [Chitinophagales bacterium]